MSLRDVVAYIVIALVIVCIVVGWALWSAENHLPSGWTDRGFKWAAFAGFSCLVFGNVVKGVGKVRSYSSFWLVLLVVMLAHVAVGVFLLRRMDRVPYLYYVPIAAGEVIIFLSAAERVDAWRSKKAE